MHGIFRLASLRHQPRNACKRLLILPVALVLAACATSTVSPPTVPGTTQPQQADIAVSPLDAQALQTLVSMQDRLYRIAAPLLVKNPELCKNNARNLLGFTAKNKYSYSADFINAAEKSLGLNGRLQVMGVLSGSGAARAGIRRGDILAAVEGNELPDGENAERQAAAVLAPLMTGRSNIKLTVVRNGANVVVDVPLTYACAFGIELGNIDNVTAYADGHRVLITRGMMNFARSDEELAYVMAKEMAHNALAHAARQRMSATIGGIIDNLTRMHPDMSTMVGMAGVKPMAENLDGMADKLAMYMLARAGYGIDNAPSFWKRLASQYPATVLNGYVALHPATDYRVAAMETAIKEIRIKRAGKRTLLP
ncbi:MAG TPA: M48 family metalloprotease [Noviherbaspirillum sp.]|nr:M48 family metalloprotease [Noviherbaspirillum sp.]